MRTMLSDTNTAEIAVTKRAMRIRAVQRSAAQCSAVRWRTEVAELRAEDRPELERDAQAETNQEQDLGEPCQNTTQRTSANKLARSTYTRGARRGISSAGCRK